MKTGLLYIDVFPFIPWSLRRTSVLPIVRFSSQSYTSPPLSLFLTFFLSVPLYPRSVVLFRLSAVLSFLSGVLSPLLKYLFASGRIFLLSVFSDLYFSSIFPLRRSHFLLCVVFKYIFFCPRRRCSSGLSGNVFSLDTLK